MSKSQTQGIRIVARYFDPGIKGINREQQLFLPENTPEWQSCRVVPEG